MRVVAFVLCLLGIGQGQYRSFNLPVLSGSQRNPSFFPVSGPPVDCEVWYDDWSPCTKTCGGGTQYREGRIEIQAYNGGRPCPPLFQQRACNNQPCQFVPNVNFDCLLLDDGLYVDPSKGCSHEYYMCSNGIATRQYCPGDLYFDKATEKCESYANVYDCSGREPVPTSTPQSNPLPRTPHPILDCRDLPDGKYPDPRNPCSKYIFICLGGVTQVQECPATLFYDVDLEACERYAAVYACSGKQLPYTTPPPQREPKKPVPIDCENLPNGNHPDPFNECSQYYYTCSQGEGWERTCPGDLYYDAYEDVCEEYTYTFACSGQKRPPPPPPEQRIDIPRPVYEFDCTDQADGNYAAGDCERFYWTCVGGETIKSECPPKLRYDLEYDECGHKLDIPRCGGERPLPPQQEFFQPPPQVDFDCSTLPDGNYPSSTNLCYQKYYSCVGGTAREFQCPGNLFYDADKDSCEPRNTIPACKHESPLPTQPILNDFVTYGGGAQRDVGTAVFSGGLTRGLGYRSGLQGGTTVSGRFGGSAQRQPALVSSTRSYKRPSASSSQIGTIISGNLGGSVQREPSQSAGARALSYRRLLSLGSGSSPITGTTVTGSFSGSAQREPVQTVKSRVQSYRSFPFGSGLQSGGSGTTVTGRFDSTAQREPAQTIPGRVQSYRRFSPNSVAAVSSSTTLTGDFAGSAQRELSQIPVGVLSYRDVGSNTGAGSASGFSSPISGAGVSSGTTLTGSFSGTAQREPTQVSTRVGTYRNLASSSGAGTAGIVNQGFGAGSRPLAASSVQREPVSVAPYRGALGSVFGSTASKLSKLEAAVARAINSAQRDAAQSLPSSYGSSSSGIFSGGLTQREPATAGSVGQGTRITTRIQGYIVPERQIIEYRDSTGRITGSSVVAM